MKFLGIDIGTSAVKAVLMDTAGTVIAKSEARLATRSPKPGWSEQDPEDWWTATLTVLSALRSGSPEEWTGVVSIGLSGQMHGAVVLDAGGSALRPAILWNDGRSQDECRQLEAEVPELGIKAGASAMPGFTAPKMLWLRTNEPDIFSRTARVLLPKDFVRFRLTGDYATDCSDAAGTLWLDQASRTWSAELVGASGMKASQMPRLLHGLGDGIPVRRSIATQLGLRPEVLVAAGAGDAAAGAIGIGAIDDGDAFLSLGTSAQLFVATKAYRPRPDLYLHSYCHALPDMWFQMAAMLNGAACLSWIAAVLGEADIEAMLAQAETQAPRPTGLVFLPYLSGERTPHNDPAARGAFIGLTGKTDRAGMVRAVLEGVAFSCLEAKHCLTTAGTQLSGLGVIGGGSRSDFWMRIVASVLDLPLTRYVGGEHGPAFGAARLAMLAIGGASVREICVKPQVRDVIVPDPQLTALYADRMPHFRNLYVRLKGAF